MNNSILNWYSDHRFYKSSDNDKSAIERIRSDLKSLLNAHHKNDTQSVIAYHEKIDQALHKLVGKRGLRPEEK